MRTLLVIAATVIYITLVLLIVAFMTGADTDDDDPPAAVEVIAKMTTTTTAPPTTTTTVAPRARTAPMVRAANVTKPTPVSDEVWDRIAACESGQRWDDTRGGYEGGLHFLHDTWVRAGGRRFAEHAYQATRRQQIDIANEWLARTGWYQWPACSRKLGLR